MTIKKIFIIDTSAILSGKQIAPKNNEICTTTSISNELKPGGRDYQSFLFLKTKGLKIMDPSKKSINIIKKTVNELGEVDRLSETDIELLALAYEIKQQKTSEPVILTDDYSIQNTANFLDIRFESISQKGIKKSFKWINRCRGCGKTFKENIKECPICGTETKKIIIDKKTLKKR